MVDGGDGDGRLGVERDGDGLVAAKYVGGYGALDGTGRCNSHCAMARFTYTMMFPVVRKLMGTFSSKVSCK